MRNRAIARIQIQNLYTVCKEFNQLPSEVLKNTTIDEHSFNCFVVREGQPKEDAKGK